MIISSISDRFYQLISFLFQRQYAKWEILATAITAFIVLLWIIRQQRSRTVRRFFEDQFRESSAVIGTNLGTHKQAHHLITDINKGRMAAVQKRHPKQRQLTKQTESTKKLHEDIKQLQYEILKYKQIEVRLEQQVADLTAANEDLQRRLAEVQQSSRQAGRQTTEVPSEKKPAAGSGRHKDIHRIVDDIRQKLCRKCGQWKPQSEFHKNASSKDGLAGSCKACKAEAAKEYRRRRKATKD